MFVLHLISIRMCEWIENTRNINDVAYALKNDAESLQRKELKKNQKYSKKGRRDLCEKMCQVCKSVCCSVCCGICCSVCCSVLQFVWRCIRCVTEKSLVTTATHCTTLQHTATHCSTLQHTAAHCSTLQHAAT